MYGNTVHTMSTLKLKKRDAPKSARIKADSSFPPPIHLGFRFSLLPVGTRSRSLGVDPDLLF